MLKIKLGFLFVIILSVAACSLWGPRSTVNKFMSGAEKGDVDTMTSLFSSKGIEKAGGLEKVRKNNQVFSDMVKGAIARGEHLTMADVKETDTGSTARVSFFYQDKAKNDSIGLGFDLSKENGGWKIDGIGNR